MSHSSLTFRRGFRDGLIIALGYVPVSFAFGIFSVSQGLSFWETLLISLVNLSSAGQLAGVPLLISGFPAAEMALTQLVINLRYSLMSVSLGQKFGDDIRFADRFWISFVNTDEIFAVSSSQPDDLSKKYMFGLAIPPYFGWAFGTAIGAGAGNILPDSVVAALALAIYGMFISILIPAARDNKAVLYCEIISAAISCAIAFLPFFSGLSTGFSIVICAVAASAVMAILRPINTEEQKEGTQ